MFHGDSVVRRRDQMATEERERMRGGDGVIALRHLLSGEELSPHGRLWADVEVPVGGSIGMHLHEGESEYYYIIAGRGRYQMDEEEHEVGPGDLTVVLPGHQHALVALGDEPVRLIALIHFDDDADHDG